MSEDACYFEGWDEETIYLRRADFPTSEVATAEFRRLSLDEFSMTADDIDGIEAIAETVPFHRSEGGSCYRGTCRTCPKVDVWSFAP